ncbi:cytochrome c oxidase subunit II [Sulfidibacter corallicola]|uniref:Cytochrome c oxidase subunit 2 n=1 Tax=Sulfidibacter corallicola TaxID=2818388 RepID=A0A8A4TCV2_SULCO|nr:cytochrome c oxidase subunit II [Sulfidibacter corallicola]QTD47929.1 cytochrome c oxidase subunit II [Sulfidibacter corallicola]
MISDATEVAARVDLVQIFIFLMMAFWFIACNAVLVYFMLRYRRKGPDDEVSDIKGSHMLEVVWTVIPIILVFIIFYVGANVWKDLRTPPEDAYEISVTAQKWSWSFKYDHGAIKGGDLFVPQGVPVKLNMISNDVIHSFFVPEFRVKEDVVPSMYTNVWFQAEHAGVYNIFCTEYCGKDHSHMLGKVHVLDPDTWEHWVNTGLMPGEKQLTPVEAGEALFVERGCKGCHSIDGTKLVGPSVLDLMGREEILEGGERVTVDDNYIMDSIKYPDRQIVAGYPKGQMPSFDGQLTNEDISNIITYLKTISSE